MAEYIERDKLLEKLHEIGGCGAAPDTWADGYDKGVDMAYGLVQRTPAADVVKVVRCKDCIWRAEDGKCLNPHCGKSWYGCPVKSKHFCSYGERRAEE